MGGHDDAAMSLELEEPLAPGVGDDESEIIEGESGVRDAILLLLPLLLVGGSLMILVDYRPASFTSYAYVVSTVSLVISTIAMLGLTQSAGGLINACNAFGFVGISKQKAQGICAHTKNADGGEDFLALALSSMRGSAASSSAWAPVVCTLSFFSQRAPTRWLSST